MTALSTSDAGSTFRFRFWRSRPSRPRAMRSRSARCGGGASRRNSSSSWTRCSACGTAGGGWRAASIRRLMGRWAAACRRASEIWTPISTESGSTRRCGCSLREIQPGACSFTSSAKCAQRRRSAATSERSGSDGDGGGSARSSAGSEASSRRPTRARDWCWLRTPSRARSTVFGSPAAVSSIGGLYLGKARSSNGEPRPRSRAVAAPGSSGRMSPRTRWTS